MSRALRFTSVYGVVLLSQTARSTHSVLQGFMPRLSVGGSRYRDSMYSVRVRDIHADRYLFQLGVEAELGDRETLSPDEPPERKAPRLVRWATRHGEQSLLLVITE